MSPGPGSDRLFTEDDLQKEGSSGDDGEIPGLWAAILFPILFVIAVIVIIIIIKKRKQDENKVAVVSEEKQVAGKDM